LNEGLEVVSELDKFMLDKAYEVGALGHQLKKLVGWPAPGSEDTELGVLMELEVRHGEAEVYP
jgi:hypothetical protein